MLLLFKVVVAIRLRIPLAQKAITGFPSFLISSILDEIII
jgi:hypothetical protein